MIALERLAACALGELHADAESEVEEHVLSCGRCAAVYASFVRLGRSVAALVQAGGASMVAPRTIVEALEREGLVSRRYVLAPGAVVPCTVGADDIYSLTTFEADLSGIERVDMIRGTQRIDDVPFEPSGTVRLITSCELIRALPSMKLPFRLVAVRPDGSEKVLAEYTLDHTAFAP